MTTASRSPAGLTRLQLDELDALMQRMLALPVNQIGEPPANLEGAVQERGLTSQVADVERPATERFVETPVAENFATQDSPAGLFPSTVDEPWQRASAVVTGQTGAHASAGPELRERPVPEPFTVEQRLVSEPVSKAESCNYAGPLANNLNEGETFKPRPTEEHLPTVVSSWLRPWAAINHVYDRATGSLGRPGRWLQSTQVRNVLGWTGLLLLAAAAGWGVFDWVYWSW